MFDHNIRDGFLNRPPFIRSLTKSSFRSRTNDCHPRSAHMSSGFLSNKEATDESEQIRNGKDQIATQAAAASEISRSPSLPSFVHSPTVSTGPVTA